MEIRPQKGPQEVFLSTPADIAIYGGGAGSGKTYSLLIEPVRHITTVPGFGGVIFRRTMPQIKNEGGMWSESLLMYPFIGGIPKESISGWKFCNKRLKLKNNLKFAHLEHEKNKYDWQGSQITFIGFDELTHFTESQFFYMLSRNRSVCGIRPYVRATCNPMANSWVAKFISWWINQETGYPIPERSGVLRWFIRINNELLWFDTKEQALDKKMNPEQIDPKSVTFIPALIHDNKILMEKDPGYYANLQALSTYEREQLLKGNWKILPVAGVFFKRENFKIVDVVPAGGKTLRYWDRAATEPNATNPDPDWTVGTKMKLMPNGEIYVENVVRFRGTPAINETNIQNTAEQDGKLVAIGLEQEPGASGKSEVDNYVRIVLKGFNVRIDKKRISKITAALPFSAQVERGNVYLLRAPWNDAYITEHENFSEDCQHDDQVDSGSGAYNMLTSKKTAPVISPDSEKQQSKFKN